MRVISILRLVLATTVAIAVVACASGGSSPAATSIASTAASPAAASDPHGSVPGSGANVGKPVTQSDTDWGRIWDSLPAAFPRIPAATPDEDAGGPPASAVLVVEGVDARTVATSLQTSLQAVGYKADGSLDPLEDGTVVLDMTGQQDGCMLQATATPTGGVTTIRILYGAGCPND